MAFALHTSRRLHAEHEAVTRLLARLERTLAALNPMQGPAPEDPAWASLARAVETAIEAEVRPHFAFEEAQLFSLLIEAGEGDLVEVLREEHVVIIEIMDALTPLLAASRSESPSVAQWQQLKTLGLEFCERLTAHAQKEDVAMLPAMEMAFDADTDALLIERYAFA